MHLLRTAAFAAALHLAAAVPGFAIPRDRNTVENGEGVKSYGDEHGDSVRKDYERDDRNKYYVDDAEHEEDNQKRAASLPPLPKPISNAHPDDVQKNYIFMNNTDHQGTWLPYNTMDYEQLVQALAMMAQKCQAGNLPTTSDMAKEEDHNSVQYGSAKVFICQWGGQSSNAGCNADVLYDMRDKWQQEAARLGHANNLGGWTSIPGWETLYGWSDAGIANCDF